MLINKIQVLLFATCILFSTFNTVHAQKFSTFQKSLGTTNDDYGSSVLELPDKGFLLGGITGKENSGDTGHFDILIIRTDSLGKQIWSKKYIASGTVGVLNQYTLNSGNSYPKLFALLNMILTPDGNAVINTTCGGTQISSGNSFLLKIDLKGNVLWSRIYNIGAGRIINAPGGGFVMIAFDTMHVSHADTTNGSVVLKINDTGGVVWLKKYTEAYNSANNNVGTFAESPTAIKACQDGGYIITGVILQDDGSNDNRDGYFIQKIDKNGTLIFSKAWGGFGLLLFHSIIQLPDKSIYLLGEYSDPEDPVILKTDSMGNVIWVNYYDNNNLGNWGKFITAFYDDLAKHFNVSYTISSNNNGTSWLGLAQLDDSGKVLFASLLGPGINYTSNLGNDMCPLVNGGFAFLQTINLAGEKGADFYFMKTDNVFSTQTCNVTTLSLTAVPWYLTGYSFKSLTSNLTSKVLSSASTVSSVSIRDSTFCPPFVANFGWQYSCSGQEIQFIDSSYDEPVSWKWDFGDGTRSTKQNPSHQYVANGTYKVKLTASNGKDTASITKTVIVKQSLPPFKSDTLICSGDSILLNAENQGSHYLWNDGDTNQTKIAKIGTYWVKITSDSCFITDTIHVKSIGAVQIKLSKDTTLCQGDTLTLKAGYAATVWSTGYVGPVIRVDTAGIYWATLKGKTCIATDTITVHVTNIIANLGTYHSTCNKSLALDPGPDTNATYKWSNGDTAKTIAVTQTGKYWVQVDKKGCTASDTTEVIIGALRGINMLPKDTFLCPHVSYSIDLSNRGASTVSWNDNVQGPQRTITKSGLYIVTLATATCKETDSMLVTYDTTIFKIGALLCQGSPFVLYGPSWKGATYLWNTGNKNNIINITQSGTYWLTVQYGKCPISDTITVEIDSPLVVNLGGNKSLCDTSLVLKPASNPGASYLWSNNDTTNSILIDTSGKYWVEAKNQSGCMASDTAIITLKKPAVFVGTNLKDTVFCSDEGALILDAGLAYKYVWTPGSDTTRKISLTDSGTYSVQISTAQGCTASKSIKITNDCTPELYIPNAFNPDSAGLNGLFKAYGVHIASFSMRIYNRWGEKLFSSNNINEGWDGRFKNEFCNTGTYIYIVNYTTEQNPDTTIKRNGTLYLMR